MAECTIYDKLRYIAETKDLIKAAIESQDVEVLESATFRQYAEYITEIRKVSSVNGMQGDVVLTIEDLGGYTKEEVDNLLKEVDVDLSDYYTKGEVDTLIENVDVTEQLANYYTKQEIDDKGYLTAVPETYITEEELETSLSSKADKTEIPSLSGYATLDYVGQEIEEVTDMFDNYYTKQEVDSAIENIDVTDKLGDYYTKQEIDDKGYLQAIPDTYITEDELSDELKDKVSETALNEALKAKQDVLTEGTGIKIEENVISLDYSYDLVEVVKELPTENIDENKIYLVQGVYPATWSIEGEFTKSSASYRGDLPNVYEQTTEGTIDLDSGKITSNFRSRLYFQGYNSFEFGIGLDDADAMGLQTQLYIAVGDVNEDLSNGLDDFTTAKAYLQGQADASGYLVLWSNVKYDNLDPSKEYFVDIWSNAGTNSSFGIKGYSYVALPNMGDNSGDGNIFIEYIYINNTWEKVGEVSANADLSGYYNKDEIDYILKGYLKEIPDEYVTQDELVTELMSYVTNSYLDEKMAYKQDDLVSGENIKTINGESILGEGDIVIQGGGSVDMDGYLRQETLTQEEYDALATVEEDVLYVIEDAAEVEVPTKVSQLENDKKYVTEDDLSNMDLGTTYTAGAGIKITDDVIELDTVSEVSTTNNTATLWKKEGTNSKISMFIINGSDTITLGVNNTNSSPILNVSDKVALKTDIPDVSTKQDVLVSGTNIKTINGNSLLGSGNIVIQGGSGEGASVIELTQAEFDALENKDQGFYLITDAQPNEYYTKSEIDALIGGVEDKITEINNMI